MEIVLMWLIYFGLFTFALNGLVLLGLRNTHKKNRRTLMALYALKIKLRK